jgi:hypothetical protein
VIAHCRKLQNVLGQIVDTLVQQNYLLRLAGTPDTSSRLPVATLACVRYLSAAYHDLEERACANFRGKFERFSEPGTREQFKQLGRTSP